MDNAPDDPNSGLYAAALYTTREHRVIQAMVTCADRIVRRALDDWGAADDDLVHSLRFFREFVEGAHVRSEEEFLFPFLAKALDLDAGIFAAQAVAEHADSRISMSTLEAAMEAVDAGADEARHDLLEHFAEYLSRLEQHLHAEDDYLYRVLSDALSPEQQRSLHATLSEARLAGLGHARSDAFLRSARFLCRRYGVDFPEEQQA
jgi:hemerythrin-like domain-containing protein